ncbi:flavodoxin, partial [Porphyromonas loveana]
VPNMADYSVIYIGSPNWWGTIAPVVMTFLEGHNFAGKTIIPFITHEGSRMGKSVNDIKKLAPKTKVLDGFAIRGRNAKNSSEDVKKELKALGQIP